MAPTVLKEFVLPTDIHTFLSIFWYDRVWYEQFLTEKLQDLSVQVSDWNEKPFSVSGGKKDSIGKSRTVSSYHPSKISFPGLPSHAESLKNQTIDVNESETLIRVTIHESNTFRGIPYADYFNVNTVWDVTGSKSKGSCSAVVKLDVVFHKSTWLQGTIESNTRAELLDVYDLWVKHAEDFLSRRSVSLTETAEVRELWPAALDSPPSQPSTGGIGGGVVVDQMSVVGSDGEMTMDRELGFLSSTDDTDDDDFTFYDCEEGAGLLGSHPRMRRESSTNSLYGGIFGRATTTEELHELYAKSEQRSLTTSREVAINFVETVFVLAQFSYWKAHQIYYVDMEQLFKVEPSQVSWRALRSFIPGWHSHLLVQPDIYGPIVAVMSLPQVLLLSMEVHGGACSAPSTLGNAVAVSLCLWLGLSCLYRVLAVVIAPTIEFKHCLSVTGYSFYAWNIALLLSYPLDAYQDLFQVSASMPLILFGLPSAIALGSMFWEHTPASSATLQTSSLPARCQTCAANHSHTLQKILWAVPKILAFLVVTGTHYQFLWYVARVFLPGRRQLCRLSAILQPTRYADILTQKELMKFATQLLKGKLDT